MNTEFVKISTLKDLSQSGHKNIPSDEIRYLCNKYLRKSDLQAACREYGIKYSDAASISDLRDALIRHFESSPSLDQTSPGCAEEMTKLFPSYKTTSGGILFALCEHHFLIVKLFLCQFFPHSRGVYIGETHLSIVSKMG